MDRCKTCPDNTNCVLPRDTCHHGRAFLVKPRWHGKMLAAKMMDTIRKGGE